MFKSESRQRIPTAVVAYTTSDTNKVLVAKHASAIVQLGITHIIAIVRTAAAQAVTVRDSGSGVTLFVIAASAAAGTRIEWGPVREPYLLPANTDLVASGTAGPAIDFTVEAVYDSHK